MGLKIGGETVGGLKIGGETVGGMKIGSEIVYRAAPDVWSATMGANTYRAVSATRKQWSAAAGVLPVRADLTAQGAGRASLTLVQFDAVAGFANLSLAGGDLSDEWETGGRIRFQTGGYDATLDAPNDRSQPYLINNAITVSQFRGLSRADLTVSLWVP